MKKKKIYHAFLIIILFFSCRLVLAQSDLPRSIVKVAIVDQKKFPVIDEVALNIWQVVAKNSGIHYVLVKFESKKEAVSALLNHQVDLILGPIKINRKLQSDILYLDSYFGDTLSFIKLKSLDSDLMLFEKFSLIFFKYLVVIFVFLFIFSLLLWYIEKKYNNQFQLGFIRGVGKAFWFFLVTASTVGYGDCVPKTSRGRFLTSIWIILSLFSLTLIIGYVSQSYTKASQSVLSSLKIDDISNMPVGYLENNYQKSILILRKKNARPVSFNTASKLINAVESKKINYALIDTASVRFYLNHHPSSKIVMLKKRYSNGKFAFAVSKNSPLSDIINEALFTVSETGRINLIITSAGLS